MQANRRQGSRKQTNRNRGRDRRIGSKNGDCLSPKLCKGKHKCFVQNELSLKRIQEVFRGQNIMIVNTPDECKAAISELRKHLEEYNVLGLDCEWLSRYRRYPVALLQLASNRGLCILIRLCNLNKIPEELKQLLADDSVLKVGINVFLDVKYLMNDYDNVRVASVLDLRPLAKECGYKSKGLGALAEEIFNVQLNKNRCISASDWEAKKLTDLQIDYAAKDAHISIELFKSFEEKLHPKPIDCTLKQNVQMFISEYCAKYLNLKKDPTKPVKIKIDYFQNQEIRYVETMEECLTATRDLKSHCAEYNVLGFKLLQTKMGTRRVDLLQLATHRRLTVYIQLDKESKNIPAELREILENKHILKVGIGIQSANCIDKQQQQLCVLGTFNLNYLLSEYRKEPLALSLSALSRWFLKVKINKNPSLKFENVKENIKKPSAKIHSHQDAHISIELFKQFIKKLEPKSDGDQEISLKDFIKKYCVDYLDVKYDKNLVQLKLQNQNRNEEIVTGELDV